MPANPKVLGIIGGMSWASTQDYYRHINVAVGRALGRQHSASLMLASIDFQPVVDAQVRDDWAFAGQLLVAQAQALERAGAGAFLIASNTMHRVLAQVQASVAIPALDVFTATAAAITRSGKKHVGLLGTKYTMQHAFYRQEYERRGITILAPVPADAKRVNDIIFHELIHGTVTAASRAFYQEVVGRLAAAGAEGVILGCTEISLLLSQEMVAVELFDTLALHADAGVAWLLGPVPD